MLNEYLKYIPSIIAVFWSMVILFKMSSDNSLLKYILELNRMQSDRIDFLETKIYELEKIGHKPQN